MPTDVPEGRGDLWQAPEWFDEIQRLQWFYAIDNAPAGLLTGSDRETLVVWVVASVEHARAAQEVRKLGQVVKSPLGHPIQNPYLPIVNRQALIMLRSGAEMGFSPASRMAMARDPSEGARWAGSGSADDLDDYLAAKPDRLDS